MTNREIDALIAEKVFGWKRWNKYGNGNGEWILPDMSIQTWNFTPDFSSDISDAWKVVAVIGQWNGFDFMLTKWKELGDTELIWRAGWIEWDSSGFEWRACGISETAPMAICLAALEAVGVEVKT